MDANEISGLRNLPADELVEVLSACAWPADDLSALRAAEAAEGDAARADVLAAIDALLITKPTAGGSETEPTESKAMPTAGEKPAWQAEDYAGPLDIAQMDWRRRNIKPAAAPAAKAKRK